MNTEKGLIQIPLLIAIVVGILILGGAGYFGVKQYQKSQQENIAKEQQAQEQKNIEQQARDAEIEKLKNEVESLKNKKPQVIIKEAPAPVSKNTTDIVSEWQSRVAEVKCKFAYSNGQVFETDSGSATLVDLLGTDNNYILTAITNEHVLLDTSKTFFPSSCTVGVYGYGARGVNFVSAGNPFSIGNPVLGNAIDIGLISLQKPAISNDNGAFDKITSSNMKVCKESQVNLGDQVVVLGYPAIGTENGITATEGIISGIENDSYVTSAKIDHGNSGGAAILVKNDCWLGIPTSAVAGSIESLGRILKARFVLGS